MNASTELQLAPRQQYNLAPQTFEQALQFADYLADSDLVPKDFKGKPSNCLIAMQWGAEIGLQPMQALQNLAVINGRPALWGDAVIAIVRGSPLCEYVQESDDGDTATCKVKRRGEAEQIRTFSMDDAKKAGLSGKQGPWTQYPKRMRQMRARAFALRDVFPDVLRGLPVAEEVMDTLTERHMGPAEVVAAPVTHYDQTKFDTNFPQWESVIKSGRRTADDLINFVDMRGEPYTEEQKDRLRSIGAKKPPTDDVQDVQAKGQSSDQPADDAPAVTYADVAGKLRAAQGMEALDEAADLIGAVTNPDHRAELKAIYDECATAIG